MPARTSRAASRKTTNDELKHELGIIKRKNNRLSLEKEEGMKNFKKLQDKLDKSEGVRSTLCATVRDAHIDKREARKNEAAAEQKLADSNKKHSKEVEELEHKLEVCGDTYGLHTRPSRQMLHLSCVSDNDMRL